MQGVVCGVLRDFQQSVLSVFQEGVQAGTVMGPGARVEGADPEPFTLVFWVNTICDAQWLRTYAAQHCVNAATARACGTAATMCALKYMHTCIRSLSTLCNCGALLVQIVVV